MARPLASILTNVSSYDPLSPSYDPYVPSPCTSFPIALPFLPAHFKKTQVNANANAFSGQASLTVPDQGISVNERLALLSRIPPPHSAPSLRRTKLCRFYLDPSGCKSGRWCNFKHPVVDVRSSSELSQLDHSSQNWDNVPDVRDLNSNWRKEKDGEVHPKFRTQPCRNFMLGLCRYGSRCQFIHPPGLLSTQASMQASLAASMEIANLAGSPLYANVLAPALSADIAPQAPRKTSSKGSARANQYAIPCSAFEMDGECPHGRECQFVHKPRTTAVRIRVEVKNNNSNGTGTGSTITTTAAAAEDKKTLNVATRKERVKPFKLQKTKGAVKEVCGIHKPTWRVVGGGVRLADLTKCDGLSDNDHNRQVPRDASSWGSATGSQSPMTLTSSPSPSTISIPSPDYLAIDPSLADLSQYDFATPTRFLHQQEFLRAPSPDVPLDITMGSPELYDLPVHHGPKKRIPLTGDDLLRMGESDFEAPPSLREKSRSKPNLTIHVPPLRKSRSSVDITRQTPFPRITRHSVGPDEMDPIVESSDDFDHALDWDDDFEQEEEREQPSAKGHTVRVVEEIRRPHSTPPTPCSSYYVEVPLLPPLPAESP